MTPPTTLFHALLRPSILQILRAAGYHGARSAVVDILTDLAARYMSELCHMTAIYASHNGSEDNPQIVDLRMALQYMGALLPEKHEMEQFYTGVEDTRGADGFITWFGGHESREIRRIAKEERDDIDAPMTDYLLALKLKHGRSEDDSKFVGTLLGKCNEHGEVLVEGGEAPTIDDWAERIHAAATRKATAINGSLLENGLQDAEDGDEQPDSRPPSSGLSSLGDRDLPDVDMLDT